MNDNTCLTTSSTSLEALRFDYEYKFDYNYDFLETFRFDYVYTSLATSTTS